MPKARDTRPNVPTLICAKPTFALAPAVQWLLQQVTDNMPVEFRPEIPND